MDRSALGPSVVVVGLGYVGLPTALALADSGCIVTGYDVSEERLAAIKAGRVDVTATDGERLRTHLGSERFDLTTDPTCLSSADAVLVCVPTPVDQTLTPDLTALSAACTTVTSRARQGQLLVLTSTTYVGCTRDLLVTPLVRTGMQPGHDVFVAFSPERIDPGNARHRPESVPRVVGGATPACRDRARQTLDKVTTTVHTVSSLEVAESTKLLENSFRAVNIAFANEFADVCSRLDLDVVEVIEAATTKPFGFMPFYPGPGVGGHCIPCDTHYLMWQMRAHRMWLPVTDEALRTIGTRPRRVVDRARQALADRGLPLAHARVLLVGVTYKPGVGDLRESPALAIIRDLRDAGARVSFTDPHVDRLELDGGPIPALTEPRGDSWDLVVLHTLHPEVDHGWLTSAPVVLDTTYHATHLPNRLVL